MSKFTPEEVSGLVRTEKHKGDEGREKPYVAVLNDGRRVPLDSSEAKSLENRLAKDRSRMEKSGTREPEREREKPPAHRQVSEAERREFLSRFRKV